MDSRDSSGRGQESAALEGFHRIVAYYLDCIREDEGYGARFFLNDLEKKYIIMPLDSEWSISNEDPLGIKASYGFIKGLRQRRSSGILLYGYPLYIDWIQSSRSGWTGGFAVPVLLQSVDYQLSGSSLALHLVSEWPRLNPEFVRIFFKSPEERRNLVERLRLDDMLGREPPQDAILQLLNRVMNEIPFPETKESINPSSLGREPPIEVIDEGGLYNRAIILIGEKSRFTKGLEHELLRLKEQSDALHPNQSALHLFFAGPGVEASEQITNPEANGADKSIVEVVPLNDEQRAAVKSSFENNLTVITGPPGTGKSQVVVSILANAYLRGQKVLFTSRNHKAVDVVEERMNALCENPLIIRAGRQSGERNLRTELLRFLSHVLSTSVSSEDLEFEKETRRAFRVLQKKRDDLWTKLEEVRKRRNLLDKLHQRTQAIKKRHTAKTWKSICGAKGIPTKKLLLEGTQILSEYLEGKTGIWRHLKHLFRRGKDLRQIRSIAEDCRQHSQLLGTPPDEVPSKENLEMYKRYFQRAIQTIEDVHVFRRYCAAYRSLKNSPTPEIFAEKLAQLEDNLWQWASKYISARGRTLPNRLDGPSRRALGEYRATIERLADDQVGGKTYANLMRKQKEVFARVSSILPIWCVTNLSARGSLPLEGGLFDLIVIDEASQCDIPSALPILYRGRRAAIIGDPNQLRHVATIEKQRDQLLQNKHGLSSIADQPYAFSNNSLFDLASTCAGSTPVLSLREHFRSHADILRFSNRQWYGNRLHICTDYSRLKKVPGERPGVKWTNLKSTVRRPSGGSAFSMEEATAAVRELKALLVDRKFGGTVGIVTPFRSQANRIRDLVQADEDLDLSAVERAELIVDTAHGFQGDERDVIFFSPCVSKEMPRGAKHFLSSTGNLFNVAITRARVLLHVIGNLEACGSCGVKHIEKFAKYVSTIQVGEDGKIATEQQKPNVGHWEMPFYKAMLKAGLNPIPQYHENQYWLDFAIKEGDFWLNIEVDGELYHKEWDGSRCRRDVIRDLRLAALGWRVKRLWVYQLMHEIDACVEEVVRLVWQGVNK